MHFNIGESKWFCPLCLLPLAEASDGEELFCTSEHCDYVGTVNDALPLIA